MRPCLLTVLLSGVLSQPALFAEQPREVPYKAYISGKDVYVRCGPGKNYYPTGKLQTGDEVEVYRHDPGGWYAIRPVQGSFSWVSARYLEKEDDTLARVTGDRVAARVGSRFSDIRDVIQVRLHRGEIVELLGEKEFQSASGAGKWFKIAPPSGEFRWVHGKYVDADYMTSGVRNAQGGNSPMLKHASTSVEQNPLDEPELLSTLPEKMATPLAEGPRQESEPDDRQMAVAVEKPAVRTAEHWGPSPGQRETAAVQPAANSTSSPSKAAFVEVPAKLAYRSPSIPELRPDDSTRPQPTPSKPFQANLEDLDMELSIMLAEEPTVWNFDELRLRAKSLLVQAQTALERGRIRALADKIQQAEEIKRRYDLVSAAHIDTERHNRQLANLSHAREAVHSLSTTTLDVNAQSRFDGIGRLARVVTPEMGAPRYALVDSEGKVTCYVSPAPGVNLHYYVGRQVGVTGIRGYLADQDTPLVTAKHVATTGWLR